MTHTARDTVLDIITHAAVGNRTRAVALHLLALVEDASGHVTLTWPDYLALCNTQHPGSARRHLTALAHAGLIHYSTNNYVYVTFLAYCPAPSDLSEEAAHAQKLRVDAQKLRVGAQPADPPRAEIARPRAENARNAQKLRVGAQFSPTPPVGRLVDPDHNPDPDNHPPTGACAPAIAADERARSIALLTDPDVGIDAATAGDVAAAVPFSTLFVQVITWRRDFEAGLVRTPRALLWRLERGWAAHVTERDTALPLYRRHDWAPDPDPDAEPEAGPEPDGADAGPSPAPSVPPDLAALWARTLDDLRLQLAASTYDTWLHATVPVAEVDGCVTIRAPNPYACDWLQHRLRSIVERTVQHVAGRPLTVQFVTVQ